LIVSALLSMSVMSAIVGFKGFPSQDLQNPIGSVLVQERQAPLAVAKHPAPVSVASAHAATADSGHVRSAARTHHGHTSVPVAHSNPVGQSGSTAADPQRSTTPVRAPDATRVVKDVTKVVPEVPSVPAPTGLLPALGLGSPDQGQAPVVQLPAMPTGVTNTVTNTVDKLLGH
jgi:hypothetical protein